MHLIQSLKNEFCFDLPLFSKYLPTSINSYFYKITLSQKIFTLNLFLTQVFDEWKIILLNLKQPFPEFITLFWNVKLNILMSLWAAFIKNVFQSSLNPICPYLQISNFIFYHEYAQKPVDSKRKPKKSLQTWQINRSSFTLKT